MELAHLIVGPQLLELVVFGRKWIDLRGTRVLNTTSIQKLSRLSLCVMADDRLQGRSSNITLLTALIAYYESPTLHPCVISPLIEKLLCAGSKNPRRADDHRKRDHLRVRFTSISKIERFPIREKYGKKSRTVECLKNSRTRLPGTHFTQLDCYNRFSRCVCLPSPDKKPFGTRISAQSATSPTAELLQKHSTTHKGAHREQHTRSTKRDEETRLAYNYDKNR